MWFVLDFRIFVLDLISSTGSNDLVLSTERIGNFWLWGFCSLSLQSSIGWFAIYETHPDWSMDSSLSQVSIVVYQSVGQMLMCKFCPDVRHFLAVCLAHLFSYQWQCHLIGCHYVALFLDTCYTAHLCYEMMLLKQIGVSGFTGIVSDVIYTTKTCGAVSWLFSCHARILCIVFQHISQRKVYDSAVILITFCTAI